MEMGSLDFVPAVEERLRAEDLAGIRPFSMVAFDAVGERGWDWNGLELAAADLKIPITSSSFHFEEVEAARRSRYHELSCSGSRPGDLLESFHSDTDGDAGPSAFTVRMCRSDAQTMSRSRVQVGYSGVHWWYWEEQEELAGEPRLFEADL